MFGVSGYNVVAIGVISVVALKASFFTGWTGFEDGADSGPETRVSALHRGTDAAVYFP